MPEARPALADSGGQQPDPDGGVVPAGTGGAEVFYIDKDGKKQDAALHAEMLADDIRPWDIHGEDLEGMTEEEIEAFLAEYDRRVYGKKE